MQSLTPDSIIGICSRQCSQFEKSIQGIRFEAKGIIHSEMLLVCAIAEHLGVKKILESGRARGQSTLVLSRFFPRESGYLVDSVECNKYTEDAIIAMKRLAGIRNLRLRFGNAFKLLPRLVSEGPCGVLIDGPKGRWAVLLASQVLRNPNVRAVFVHDTHRDSDCRGMIENFYRHAFFTDNKRFVETFKYLDETCWERLRQYSGYEDWRPYWRGSRRMASYSGTLAMILNEPTGLDKVDECRQYMEEHLKAVSLSEWLRRPVRRFKKVIRIPYWFTRYHIAKVSLQKD